MQMIAAVGFGLQVHCREGLAAQHVVELLNLDQSKAIRTVFARPAHFLQIGEGDHVTVVVDHEGPAVLADL
jgi:hypothetical protein